MPAKFDIPLKRSPKSDPQQYRLYRMENEAIGGRHYCQLQDLEIISLIRSVCAEYQVPQAKVEWADLGRWAAEWQGGKIRLNRHKVTARSVLAVLHESAHHIHGALAGELALSHESHGPEFVACYMSVLDTARIIPVVGMRAICDGWGIRYIDPGTRQSLVRLKRICQGKNLRPHRQKV